MTMAFESVNSKYEYMTMVNKFDQSMYHTQQVHWPTSLKSSQLKSLNFGPSTHLSQKLSEITSLFGLSRYLST